MTSTRAINAAAGVIHASLQQGKTLPASIAYALDSACLLNSPEFAAELEQLRRELESARVDGRRLIQAEQRRAELEAVLRTHRDDDRAEIERLRARVAELEAAAGQFLIPWATKLDAKSLDNFLADLGRATEHEPLDAAPHEIERTVASWRELVAERLGSGPVSVSPYCDHPNGYGPYGCAGCGEFAPPDDDPLPEALHASSGAVIDTARTDDVRPQVTKLRALLAGQREDVYSSPLARGPHPVPHDLPRVSPAAKCRCDEPGSDPYACEADDCSGHFSELNPFGAGTRPVNEPSAEVSRRCADCDWRTSVWHVDDGSAEAELHGHVSRVHGSRDLPGVQS